MPVAIFALTLSAFGIGTSEFVINGLLLQIARDFDVSISAAGMLVSGFALGIIVGAPALTALTLRVPRKMVLQGALLLFTFGSAVSAAATDYWFLMTGRVLSAMAVGAFYGVGSVTAALLAGPQRQASAVAVMFAGATAATVFGVPLGTLVGQEHGWRVTYWIVTAIGAAGFVSVSALVPHVVVGVSPSLRNELAAFRNPQVWLAFAITAASFGAISTTLTYIAPLLTDVAGFSERSLTLLLLVVGCGLFCGNYLGGRAADHDQARTIIGLFALFAVVLLAFRFTVHDKAATVVTVFLFGFAGYGLVPGAQINVMKQAAGAPTLASAMNISAFNAGVMLGAAAGGLAIASGLGLTSVTLIGTAIAVLGLALAIISHRRDKSASRKSARPMDAPFRC